MCQQIRDIAGEAVGQHRGVVSQRDVDKRASRIYSFATLAFRIGE